MKLRRNIISYAAGGIFLLLVTALLLQSVIFQRSLDYMLQRSSLKEYVRVTTRYVGMFGAGVGPVAVGETTGAALTITTADINYSPATLLHKKITSLSLSGITIPLVLGADGTVTVPFFPSTRQSDNKTMKTRSHYLHFLHSIEQVAMSGQVHLDIGNGKKVSIPFAFHSTGKRGKEVAGSVQVLGNDMSVSAVQKKKGIELTASASGMSLASLHTILEQYGVPNMQGEVGWQVKLFLDNSTGTVSGYHADIKLRKITAAGSWGLVKSGALSVWQKKSSIVFQGSADLSLPAFETAKLSWSGSYDKDGAVQVDATGTVAVLTGPFLLNSTIPLHCQGRSTDSGAWNGTCREGRKTTVQVRHKNNNGAAENSIGMAEITHIRVDTAGGHQTTLTGSIGLSSLTVKHQEQLFSARNIQLSGAYGRTQKSKGELEAKVALQEVKSENNNLVFQGAVHATAQTLFADDGSSSTQGKITIEQGTGLEKNSALQVGQIEADIPFSWPWSKEQNKTGTLRFSNMVMGSMVAGSMILHLRKKARGFAVNGHYGNNAFGALSMNIAGELSLDQAHKPHGVIHYDMDVSEIETEKAAHPYAKLLSFQGFMGSSGTLLFENGQLQGGGKFRVQDGFLQVKQGDVKVSGIMTSMQVKDSVRFISFPAQRIDFEKISAGKITAGPGSVVVQVEGKKRVFIEQGMLHWAGGTIQTTPFRVHLPLGAMATVLYCDRLRVADMISILGSAAVEGDGLVSGMLPVTYSKGRLSFKDGYLYTKPGIGGRIRLLQAGNIIQGIPGASAEQVHFVLAALNDFSYDWVRFAINSDPEEDAAAIKMEMYGRPASPLPFSYKNGTVVHVEGASGIQSPIQFTMNFTLPLNALIGSLHGVRNMQDRLQQAP